MYCDSASPALLGWASRSVHRVFVWAADHQSSSFVNFCSTSHTSTHNPGMCLKQWCSVFNAIGRPRYSLTAIFALTLASTQNQYQSHIIFNNFTCWGCYFKHWLWPQSFLTLPGRWCVHLCVSAYSCVNVTIYIYTHGTVPLTRDKYISTRPILGTCCC